MRSRLLLRISNNIYRFDVFQVKSSLKSGTNVQRRRRRAGKTEREENSTQTSDKPIEWSSEKKTVFMNENSENESGKT